MFDAACGACGRTTLPDPGDQIRMPCRPNHHTESFALFLAKHVATASRAAPTIAGKDVSPQVDTVLQHTCAMHTLQATRDVQKALAT
jgi:hypothetical protein